LFPYQIPRPYDSNLYLGYQTPIQMALAFIERDIRLGYVHQCQDTRSSINTGGISARSHHHTQILHTVFYNAPPLLLLHISQHELFSVLSHVYRFVSALPSLRRCITGPTNINLKPCILDRCFTSMSCTGCRREGMILTRLQL
jgi:hypothetical protein